MAAARLEVVVGDIHFSADGTEEWVSTTFAKFLDQTANIRSGKLLDGKVVAKAEPSGEHQPPTPKSLGNLASFIRQHNGNTTQVRRFLAASLWLQRSGASLLKTSDVAKALLDARQQPLNNPADVLNQNVAKGFCVKSGEGFYVTSEGEESLSQ